MSSSDSDDSSSDSDDSSSDGDSSSGSNNHAIADTDSTSEDSSIDVTLTDRDVLTCPICSKYLTVPVYQCENGHILCSPCCLKLKNKCPYCTLRSGRIRCRAVEKVLESLKVHCKNKKFGCKETVAISKKRTHEKQLCPFAPCSCPVQLCKFVGSVLQLQQHCRSKHSGAGVITCFSFDKMLSVSLDRHKSYVVLQERTSGRIFVLRNKWEVSGNSIYVTRIGPACTKTGMSYDLIARDKKSSLTLQSPTSVVNKLVLKHPPSIKSLLVSKSAFGPSKKIKLEIYIWKRRRLHRPVSI